MTSKFVGEPKKLPARGHSVASIMNRVRDLTKETDVQHFIYKGENGNWNVVAREGIPEGVIPFLTFSPGEPAMIGFHPQE